MIDNNNENVQGLKNGRPPAVSEEKLLEIRKELSKNPSGWKVKQIMNIIYDKTGVRYHHEVHAYSLLHKWGFSPKVPGKKFINAASKEEKEQFKKKTQKIISNRAKDFTIVIEDR
jgi:transposase